jgi:hypothetical protein
MEEDPVSEKLQMAMHEEILVVQYFMKMCCQECTRQRGRDYINCQRPWPLLV